MAFWTHDVRVIHETVAKRWAPWSPEDLRFLSLALAGEVGEFCNLIKKAWRGDITKKKRRRWKAETREELADIRIYLELVARAMDVDLDDAVREKLPELRRRWPKAARRLKSGLCCANNDHFPVTFSRKTPRRR